MSSPPHIVFQPTVLNLRSLLTHAGHVSALFRADTDKSPIEMEGETDEVFNSIANDIKATAECWLGELFPVSPDTANDEYTKNLQSCRPFIGLRPSNGNLNTFLEGAVKLETRRERSFPTYVMDTDTSQITRKHIKHNELNQKQLSNLTGVVIACYTKLSKNEPPNPVPTQPIGGTSITCGKLSHYIIITDRLLDSLYQSIVEAITITDKSADADATIDASKDDTKLYLEFFRKTFHTSLHGIINKHTDSGVGVYWSHIGRYLACAGNQDGIMVQLQSGTQSAAVTQGFQPWQHMALGCYVSDPRIAWEPYR